MRSDNRVLAFTARDDGCAHELSAEYLAGRYDGIHLRVVHGSSLSMLNVSPVLSGLKYLQVSGPVKDDTAAFNIAGYANSP
jgi:hypothetical protein